MVVVAVLTVEVVLAEVVVLVVDDDRLPVPPEAVEPDEDTDESVPDDPVESDESVDSPCVAAEVSVSPIPEDVPPVEVTVFDSVRLPDGEESAGRGICQNSGDVQDVSTKAIPSHKAERLIIFFINIPHRSQTLFW